MPQDQQKKATGNPTKARTIAGPFVATAGIDMDGTVYKAGDEVRSVTPDDEWLIEQGYLVPRSEYEKPVVEPEPVPLVDNEEVATEDEEGEE